MFLLTMSMRECEREQACFRMVPIEVFVLISGLFPAANRRVSMHSWHLTPPNGNFGVPGRMYEIHDREARPALIL